MNGESEVYLSLVMPAFNEADRISAALTKVDAYLSSLRRPYEILVVDDGSTDSTVEKVRKCAASCDELRLISYGANRGKGYAVRQGVLASRGEYVAFSDADLSAPIEELSKLFIALNRGFDIAIGSRALRQSELTLRQPLYRELGGKALNLVIRLFAVPGIRDTQCGLKLFRREVAREIFGRCFVDGWAFDVETLYLARRMGYDVAETPIRWAHAEGSKVRPLRAGLQVLRDIARVRMHNYDL